MAGLDFLLFGYREITVLEGDPSRVADAFLRLGVSAILVGEGRFAFGAKYTARVKSALAGRVKYTLGDVRGLPGLIPKMRKNLVVILCAVLMIFTYFASGLIVWDVRVSGNERLSKEEIVAALDGVGLGVGDAWWSFSKGEVEAELLSELRDIAWVSVNRRGTVAYVEVVERALAEDSTEAKDGYYSIVADTDCVIESITVAHGRAVVAPGDSVRRGDVLISGVVEGERGYELVKAEGVVIGRCSATVSARADKIESAESLGEPFSLGYRIKFFDFSLNIFKNGRKNAPTCDIIEKEMIKTELFGKKLPFGIYSLDGRERITHEVNYTEAELPRIASDRINAEIFRVVGNGDLVNRRSSGMLDGTGYKASCEIIYSKPVGTPVKIGENG